MFPNLHTTTTGIDLAEWVKDARQRSIDLVYDLTNNQLMGPKLPTINPLVWEIGHVAYFQEVWVLRHAYGDRPIFPQLDALYDSIAIPHEVRWDLPLLARDDVLDYASQVAKTVLGHLSADEPTDQQVYMIKYSVFHEDMHAEAFTYTRQTLAYPRPQLTMSEAGLPVGDERLENSLTELSPTKDVVLPGGSFRLGAEPDEPFVFDNEKWAHPVRVRPFAISRLAVTQSEFAAFVESDGYRRREFWCPEGWKWRESQHVEYPIYWRREPGRGWARRDFDQWVTLEPSLPMLHVNWYEASAYCRWARRRLPTELEWEVAASTRSTPDGTTLWHDKSHYPWGDHPPTPYEANLDGHMLGTVDVSHLPAGESPSGCRNMIGNVWEWTSTLFQPYPGFVPDMYQEYSQSGFGLRRVLRGGCWATRGRLIRNTWRNYYTPERRDVWAGFRTCATE